MNYVPTAEESAACIYARDTSTQLQDILRCDEFFSQDADALLTRLTIEWGDGLDGILNDVTIESATLTTGTNYFDDDILDIVITESFDPAVKTYSTWAQKMLKVKLAKYVPPYS